MTDPQAVEALRASGITWSTYRQENADIDLFGADLTRAELTRADLAGANLREVTPS